MAMMPEHGGNTAPSNRIQPEPPDPGISRRNLIIGGGTAVAAGALASAITSSAAAGSTPT